VSVSELWRILVRRRWLIVVALVVALAAGAAGYVTTKPRYSQTQSYLLLYPVVTEQGRGNPFLQLGNGVGMAAAVLTKRVSGGETAQQIVASEPGLQYTVALDPTTSAPILVVTAEAPSPAVVSAALDRLGAELVAQLDSLQKSAGAPQATWVTISRLTGELAPQASYSDSLRTGVLGAGGTLLLALLLVAGAEARRLRGLRRDSSTAAAGVPRERPLPPRPTPQFREHALAVPRDVAGPAAPAAVPAGTGSRER
jgi:hypothetical protein